MQRRRQPCTSRLSLPTWLVLSLGLECNAYNLFLFYAHFHTTVCLSMSLIYNSCSVVVLYYTIMSWCSCNYSQPSLCTALEWGLSYKRSFNLSWCAWPGVSSYNLSPTFPSPSGPSFSAWMLLLSSWQAHVTEPIVSDRAWFLQSR